MWAHSSQRISSSKGQTMCSWRELNFERNKIYPKFARFKKIDNLGYPVTDVLVMVQTFTLTSLLIYMYNIIFSNYRYFFYLICTQKILFSTPFKNIFKSDKKGVDAFS